MTGADLPGSSGLPWLGETLAFIADGFVFANTRAAAHGPIVRTRVLGEDAVLLSGVEATEAFNDPERVQRSKAAPSFVIELFAGESLPFIDGDTHRARKALVMSAFTHEALAGYFSVFVPRVAERLKALCAGGAFSGEEAYRRLVLELIAETLLGLDDRAVVDAVVADFSVLAAGFGALPVALPGGGFSRALAARDRIVGHLRAALKAHQATPRDDGLGRMLKYREAHPEAGTDEEIVRELHHFNIAGYITFAHLCEATVALAETPALAAALRDEVGAGAITPSTLRNAPQLVAFVEEVKRLTRFAPVFFGRAKAAFSFAGKTVPEGWLVLWAHANAQRDAKALVDPERFDHTRFLAPREEHLKNPAAVSPQGYGDPHRSHKCAGYDFATTLLQVIVATLVQGYDVTLPAQDLTLKTNTIPPHRPGALRVSLRAR
ncbi:MAG: cytochrome P450 [Myxococcales bacterium]|nr:cytochrome P450 [Myxococcales bacterium]